MNRNYAETYEEHKSGKYEYVKGYGRLGCYQGLDYIENILKDDKYYSEALEDGFIFIQSYINCVEQQCKKQQEVIDKIEKYIEKQARMYELSMPIELGTHLYNILGILKEVSDE
jgi:hypothetical protein